jgi:hypothetical protein
LFFWVLCANGERRVPRCRRGPRHKVGTTLRRQSALAGPQQPRTCCSRVQQLDSHRQTIQHTPVHRAIAACGAQAGRHGTAAREMGHCYDSRMQCMECTVRDITKSCCTKSVMGRSTELCQTHICLQRLSWQCLCSLVACMHASRNSTRHQGCALTFQPPTQATNVLEKRSS